MASPFRYFRKHQKAFLAVAAVIAIFLFVIGDSVFRYIGQSSGGSRDPSSQVTSWKGGALTFQELEVLSQRRYFLSEFLRRLQITGAKRIIAEGGTPVPPQIPNFVIQEGTPSETVRSNVVMTRVLAEQGRKAGIVVSDELVNQYLREASFRRVTDIEILGLMQGIRQGDPKALEDQLFSGLRELLVGNTFGNSFSASTMNMLPQQRWEDWRQINDRIALETATLTATDFVSEVPEPSEAEVLAFYEKYKDHVPGMQHLVLGARLPAPDPGFKQPRRVKLNYVMGDVFAWRDKYRDSVTTEEIADYYQRNKRTQFVKSGSSGSASFDDKLFDKPAGDEQPAEDSGESESDSDSEKAPEENGESKPAEEDSSSVAPGKAFQLTAFQADAEKDSDSAESDKNEPEGDAPSDDSEKSAETSADEPASTDTKEEDADGKETSEKDTEVEYDSLEDVRDSIRDKLATDKAVVELKSIIERLYGELQTEYNPYGFLVISARADKTEIPTPPANLINLKDRAAAVGLTSEETVLLTQQALSETFVGKALDVQTKQEYVLQAVFSSLELYQPLLAQDLDGNWYLVTKVEDVPERIPSLEDIRDEVISAWKKQEASKLALKKGEELASECQKIGDTLANFLIGKPYEVLTTDLFSYLSYGTTPVEMQSGPKLGDAPPLEAIGPEFMAKAFDLGEKNVAAVPSYDQTKVYVIRLDHRERTQDGLRELFLKEANTWYGGQVMSMIRAQNQQRAVFGQVAERVGLDLENLNQNLQPNEDEEE